MGKNPGSGTATNNKENFFLLKVNLRLNSLPDRDVKVLECFAGEGKIWKVVEQKFKHQIKRTRIDINEYDGYGNVKEDSLRIINKINLEGYDLIDLDSWGSPLEHVEVLINRGYKGVVHCTYCSPMAFNTDKKTAAYYGMNKYAMKQKPVLFAKNLSERIRWWLWQKGIEKVYGYMSNKANYFWFRL